MTSPVLAPVRSTFRAAAATIVPEAARLTPGEWLEVEAIVEDYLSRRPARVRRQLQLFMRVLALSARARYGRALAALDPDRRTRLLSTLQDSPILLLRRGLWGLRTMVYLGYYSRPAAAPEIGYRANVRGWEARR